MQCISLSPIVQRSYFILRAILINLSAIVQFEQFVEHPILGVDI